MNNVSRGQASNRNSSPAWLWAAVAVTVLAIGAVAASRDSSTLRLLAFQHAARTRNFSFDYAIEPDDLVVKFSADGWIYLHFSPGADTIEHARVTAGQTRREPIPNNATEVNIIYSASESTGPGQGVEVTRTGKSGTVEDPSAKRIELLLKFY